ncbi:MAG: response regulator transcription factor [Actinomycetes bacterium]
MSIDTNNDNGSPKPISVLLVDGYPLVRQGAQNLIAEHTEFTTIKMADSYEDARRYALGHKPDLAIIGPNLDEGTGGSGQLAAIAAIHEASPNTRILVILLSDFDTVGARDGVAAGAAGVISMASSEADFIDAARRVTAGEEYVSAKVSTLALREREQAQYSGPLTPREAEVLRSLALGYTNSEIAKGLHLSVRTIETHRANLQGKLRLRTRAELVAHAIETGLLGAAD